MALSQDEAPQPPRPGRQNDLLRKYFREQYMTLHGGNRREESPFFVESFIDQRIDAFLDEIEKKIAEIRSLEAEIDTLREGNRSGPAPDSRKALKRLEDRLEDVRRALSPVFLELDAKSRFKPDLHPADGLDAEFEFLHERIDEAEAGIRAYLFSAGTTVSVATLRHGDILVALFEAGRMAKALSREF